MEQAVEQYRLESKMFEVKMNKVLNEKERLLEQVINKDIVNIIMNSSVDNASVNVHECEKCLKLETELLNKKDNSVSNQSAPSFDQLFELNELKAQSQEKDTVIKKLKERIKSLMLLPYAATRFNILDQIILTSDSTSSKSKHRYSNLMIQPEPEGSTQGYPPVTVEVLRHDTKGVKRFYTSTGNPVKEILLKLNLPDHRLILTDSKVTPTKHGRMTNLYSSSRLIANCFNAGYLKMEVKVPDSSCLKDS
ncbi:hypothetical protein Tco_0399700 [Tanacetum coccineum]